MIETKLLRIPRELKEKLEKQSEKIGISLNALILQALWKLLEENKE